VWRRFKRAGRHDELWASQHLPVPTLTAGPVERAAKRALADPVRFVSALAVFKFPA
jgi:hypothetical protein